MRINTHVIVTALNLYFDGLSTRKVVTQIKDIFGEDVSQVTVWNWIQKYSKLASIYALNLTPTLSGKIHHDETMIKVDGSHKWFWEAIDEDTRFLVASHLSGERNLEETVTQFQAILENGRARPQALFVDGSHTYDRAFNKVFYSRYKVNRVELVKRVGIRARETNNIVERLHGTLKDRLKPMRGLKHTETARTILNRYVTHYNLCRSHQSLKGKTPAQVAGIELRGWKNLLIEAQTYKTKTEANKQIIEVKVRL